MLRFGRIVVLVRDYEEALAFYTEAFGCRVIHDTTGASGQRFLHLGFPDDGSGIWLLATEDESRIGEQTGGEPLMVLYTDDLIGLYEHLNEKGVPLTSAITRTPDASFFHCADLYGNDIVVVRPD